MFGGFKPCETCRDRKMHGMKEMFIPPFAQIVVKMFRINIGKNI